jgi:hypothetical protein
MTRVKPLIPDNGRTTVRVAYLTTDEVNQELALQLAAGLGVDLCVLSPRDPAGLESFAGVLYDLDYLPESRRREILADLLAGPPPCPVAVHSYNLDADQERLLCENGVLVSRRLEAELFLRLTFWASAPSGEAKKVHGSEVRG